ncbi:MAG: ketoacyl-ACP synthase III [Saprospiraceae bacterium]|nr:ketoacyl-ACP synthase III [Saprospiraceae bacterium]
MNNKIYTKIIGTGSYIPTRCVKNTDFLDRKFYNPDGTLIDKSNEEIIDKFQQITTISERRFVKDHLVTSDIAFFAAKNAIEETAIDKESLDYIIVAHNFGDVRQNHNRTDLVPTLAARVKQKLKIINPNTIAYDLPFGCPGWLQAVIQGDYFIRSGDVKRILVIGAEVLSRVSDPHDRDSMLYADGAAATLLEAKASSIPTGLLAHKTRSDTLVYASMLHMGKSYHSNGDGEDIFLKMSGRKLYQYALETVPQSIKACLDSCHLHIDDIKYVLIHQANGKMDDAILQRLYALYDIETIPQDVMPMTVSYLGNSSVATIPTLLDLILKNQMENYSIAPGDRVVFASVGAGMNINAAVHSF